MKRRSSKGNPNHWPKGTPKGGQFAPKGSGISINNTADYYEAKTRLRSGEISKEDFYEMVKPDNRPSNTPEYDTFVSKISKTDISTPNGKRKCFKDVCSAAGFEVDVPIRMTKGKNRTGSCRANLKQEDGKLIKVPHSVTLSSCHSEEMQMDTLYHEAYHYCSMGGETTSYHISGRGVKANKEHTDLEETMAVCSARALCKDTGYEGRNSASYSQILIETLPRLKQNTEKFQGCNTIEDFGRIAWNDRLQDRNEKWGGLNKEMKSQRLRKGYYAPYCEYINQNREKIVDKMMSLFGSNDPRYRQQITDTLTSANRKMETSGSTDRLSRDEKIAFSQGVMSGFFDLGVL